MKFHPKNYQKNNTPKFIQKLGDAMLLAGVIGGVIATAPISLPTIIVTTAGYLATIGAIGKAITKCFSADESEL